MIQSNWHSGLYISLASTSPLPKDLGTIHKITDVGELEILQCGGNLHSGFYQGQGSASLKTGIR